MSVKSVRAVGYQRLSNSSMTLRYTFPCYNFLACASIKKMPVFSIFLFILYTLNYLTEYLQIMKIKHLSSLLVNS